MQILPPSKQYYNTDSLQQEQNMEGPATGGIREALSYYSFPAAINLPNAAFKASISTGFERCSFMPA